MKIFCFANDCDTQKYFALSMSKTSLILLLICITTMSGCKSLTTQPPEYKTESQAIIENINYAKYYLLLTQFSKKQLADEAQYQNSFLTQKEMNNDNLLVQAQLKSVLLYAQPYSALYSPFTAKTKLNQLSFENLQNKVLTPVDFAFFNMLKTQLNQQIILLNQLSKEKQSNKVTKQLYTNQQLEFKKLKQQIIQLKKIEQNINEHGQ